MTIYYTKNTKCAPITNLIASECSANSKYQYKMLQITNSSFNVAFKFLPWTPNGLSPWISAYVEPCVFAKAYRLHGTNYCGCYWIDLYILEFKSIRWPSEQAHSRRHDTFLWGQYDDITWTSWCFKSPETRPFVRKCIHVNNKETRQFRIAGPFLRESTSDQRVFWFL